jgi:DNA-binding CsgD family transcriptional regulator
VLGDSGARLRGAADRRWDLLSAWVALRRGDWTGSLAIVEQIRAGARVLEPRDALLADAVEAGVARRQGDLDTMTRVWRHARTLLLRRIPDLLGLQPAGELLIVGARLKDRGTVRTSLMGLRELIARAGLPPLWALSLLWDELHIQLALDDHDAARAAVKLADELARPGTRAEAVTDAAICWTDALTADADPVRVRATASGLAETGLAWEAARLAGAAAIRAVNSAQMRELLMFARDLTARQASAVQEPASELSPRERDVAVHLLSGLTHREIGGLLFIAPKTVEHHVARIRRKLGARSRAELLVALRRHLPEER